MTELERRHLDCLIAISEHRSISAAARTLHLSQPAVSRTLAQLEGMVGEQLVDRSTHHLALTSAGQRFIGPARDAATALDQAVAAARGEARPLRFGHSWATSERAAAITRAWRQHRRRSEVQLVFCEERLAGIERGTCDVALGRGDVDGSLWRSAVIGTEHRYAIVPSTHRLARRTAVTLSDLADERLVISSLGTTTTALWPAGAGPTEIQWVSSTEAWLTDIAAGEGVGVTVESIVASRPNDKVRYIRLTDAPDVPLVLVSPRTPTHQATRSFIQSVTAAPVPPGRR